MTPLSFRDTVSLILEIVKQTPAIVIIDALDECHRERRSKILEALQAIITLSPNVVKVRYQVGTTRTLFASLRDLETSTYRQQITSKTFPDSLFISLIILSRKGHFSTAESRLSSGSRLLRR